MPWGRLAAVALLALLVRVPPLGRSLWFDEVFSMEMASRDPAALVEAVRHGDTHPAGWYLALRAWLHVVPGDLGGRLLSLAAGLSLVALLGLLGARLAGPRVGWLAATLAAVSPQLAWISYEIRSFACFALITTALWAAVEGALARGRLPWLAAVALLTAAALHTFYYAGVVSVSLLAYVLVRPAPPARRWAVLGAAALGSLALLPWLPVLADQLERARALSAQGRSGPGLSVRFVLERWLGQHLLTAAPWGAWPALGGLGALALLRRRRWGPVTDPAGAGPAAPADRAPLVATLAAAGGFVLGVLVFALLGGMTGGRYSGFLAGVWCVGAALLLTRLPPRLSRAATIVLVVGGFSQSLVAALRGPREDWRSATSGVRAEAAPDAAVAVWPWWASICVRHYAEGHPALRGALGAPQELPWVPGADGGGAEDARVRAWLEGRSQAFVVRADRYDGREERDPGQLRLLAALERLGFRARPRWTVAGLEVLRFDGPR